MGEFACEGILILVETFLLFATGFAGLVASIVLGLAKDNFAGDCLLYSEVKWCNSTAFYFTQLGASPSCSFCIGLQVCVSFYALAYGCYHVSVLCQWVGERRALVLPTIIIDVLVSLFVFIQACVLSVGFKRFCDGFVSGSSIGSKAKSCSYGGKLDWNFKGQCGGDKDPHNPYAGDNFFQFYSTAQSASWFTLLFWLVLIGITIARRLRNATMLPTHTEAQEERKSLIT
ncbi:transmembrane protein 179B-like isoform X2 [Amphiura filiformis]|uniref:transmembrane protein 179B-like isoform X2 n=1 Tax=Amphiura filiformis TaxID=82378 RepID=UPI003B21B104